MPTGFLLMGEKKRKHFNSNEYGGFDVKHAKRIRVIIVNAFFKPCHGQTWEYYWYFFSITSTSLNIGCVILTGQAHVKMLSTFL